MRLRLTRIGKALLQPIFWLPPLIYCLLLLVEAFQYRSYYGNNILQVQFDGGSLIFAGFLGFIALAITFFINRQDKKEIQESFRLSQEKVDIVNQENISELKQRIDNSKYLILDFLVNSRLEEVFNSDHFKDLRKEETIKEVKKLAGGYSGAKTYLIHLKSKSVPFILKVGEKEEIENERHKFDRYVKDKLVMAPKKSDFFEWGSYAGITYDLAWGQDSVNHLNFEEIYKQCLKLQFPHETIEQIIGINGLSLFGEIIGENSDWGWNKIKSPEKVNIYQEYFPFTRQFMKINPEMRAYSDWGKNNIPNWIKYETALKTLLNVEDFWGTRCGNSNYETWIARATIHGDLNSRNILIEVDPNNHNLSAIRLVDFSHTGNGLTKKTTDNFSREDVGKAHIANDFCRLEADIKFYLTDLEKDQEVRQAWVLECIFLKQFLELEDWEQLLVNNRFKEVLDENHLSTESEWEELTKKEAWEREKINQKFILMWRCVRTIRKSLFEILKRQGLKQDKGAFYMALLQASLSMIYYEDERFNNAYWQKRYLVLACGLLCEYLDSH